MTLNTLISRPLTCLKSISRVTQLRNTQHRFVSAGSLRYRAPPPEPSRKDPWAPAPPKPKHKIKIIPPPASIKKTCPEPLRSFNASQLALLDPSGARTRLFSPINPERACLGDVLLVRFKNGDPFYGVHIALRRHGPDTSILLRNTVRGVGAEMWIKIYNPTVMGIEIVQRTARKARRARLYYMRKPEHDRGDLSGILNEYLKTRRTLGVKKKDKVQKLEAQKAARDKTKENKILKMDKEIAKSKKDEASAS